MRRTSGGASQALADLTGSASATVLTTIDVVRNDVLVRTAASGAAPCSTTNGLSPIEGSLQLPFADIIGPPFVAMSAWQWPDVTGTRWHSVTQTTPGTGAPVNVSTISKVVMFVT